LYIYAVFVFLFSILLKREKEPEKATNLRFFYAFEEAESERDKP
jgi:hypothetical protein